MEEEECVRIPIGSHIEITKGKKQQKHRHGDVKCDAAMHQFLVNPCFHSRRVFQVKMR